MMLHDLRQQLSHNHSVPYAAASLIKGPKAAYLLETSHPAISISIRCHLSTVDIASDPPGKQGYQYPYI